MLAHSACCLQWQCWDQQTLHENDVALDHEASDWLAILSSLSLWAAEVAEHRAIPWGPQGPGIGATWPHRVPACSGDGTELQGPGLAPVTRTGSSLSHTPPRPPASSRRPRPFPPALFQAGDQCPHQTLVITDPHPWLTCRGSPSAAPTTQVPPAGSRMPGSFLALVTLPVCLQS